MAKRKNQYQQEPELLTDRMIIGKGVPANIEAENALLGAMLIDRGIIPLITSAVHPEMFYSQQNQVIYKAIWDLFYETKPVDMITVKGYLEGRGELETAGGLLYILNLTSGVVSASNAEFHAKLVHEQFIKRKLIQVAHKVNQMGYDALTDAFDVMDFIQVELFGLSSGAYKKTFQSYAQVILQNLEEMQRRMLLKSGMTGIDTGFHLQNKVTSGWQNGELVIIGARPSMGKTALALYYAVSAAKTGKSVLFFSLEMSASSLVFRIQSMESGIEGDKIKSGRMTDQEFQTFKFASEDGKTLPIYIDDTASISVQEMKSKTLRMVHEGKVDLVIVDYIQLMTAGNHIGGNREQEVAYISKNLKALAKDCEVPVIALAQINRSVENGGKDKRPMLSSLRESGSMEQDADMVIFPYRPEYYGDEVLFDGSTPSEDMAEIIIAKQRNGALATFPVRYEKRLTRFGQYTPENAYNPVNRHPDMYIAKADDFSHSAPF